MKKNNVGGAIFSLIIIGIVYVSCTGPQKPHIPPEGDGNTSFRDIDLDKKFLQEGFITDELYRVVIISAKDGGNPNMQEIQSKARIRARVSLERILMADSRNYNKNSTAGILNLIENNGALYKKDIGHKNYEVYYFEITKKDLKNSLRNIRP
jgi:hypothetical protein